MMLKSAVSWAIGDAVRPARLGAPLLLPLRFVRAATLSALFASKSLTAGRYFFFDAGYAGCFWFLLFLDDLVSILIFDATRCAPYNSRVSMPSTTYARHGQEMQIPSAITRMRDTATAARNDFASLIFPEGQEITIQRGKLLRDAANFLPNLPRCTHDTHANHACHL